MTTFYGALLISWAAVRLFQAALEMRGRREARAPWGVLAAGAVLFALSAAVLWAHEPTGATGAFDTARPMAERMAIMTGSMGDSMLPMACAMGLVSGPASVALAWPRGPFAPRDGREGDGR